MQNEFFKSVCIKPVYIDGYHISLYKVGTQYETRYLYDKCVFENNNIIEFEWMVYCSKYNHFQFTDEDFHIYFADLSKQRDMKINDILEINI